ncbi:HK97 gp10 family phage protein [Halarchaeum rubridurum]|uniref:HK97 gp10 family phage protein n=1 Tax=Halarchaeum rubridurum TaxID=489911 RepID=A0A830FY07_9EURY|nr:HK97 gp10 family phage protein [Halarchaeum rubridurum]MBP1953570.1 HK97 gp10 family phage protein [Halarchaeum rubridurum]GGM64315.1 hypothetical protein GCM10009017_12910 [Halarchaeum rubridurum]
MTQFNGFEDLAEEFSELAQEFEAVADRFDSAVDTGVRDTTLQIEATAKENVSVDSGTLRSSLAHLRAGQADYRVGTNVPYAEDVEKGTSPHVITPDDADALHFTVNGQEVFAARVEHPGTPAQPYLGPALHEHEDALVENIQDEIARLLRAVFR